MSQPKPNYQFPPILRKSWYSLNQAFRRKIAHLAITPNHYTILRWLTESNTALTQKEIVTRMSSDANTIAAIITRLESKKLITKYSDTKDKRAQRVAITATGAHVYQAAQPIADKLQSDILKCIPKNEQKKFLAQLTQIAQACQESLKD